ncbi:N-glycosylase/DNA lyase-like [Babylonia areolata]|uniref:N-glycosylase/DNA lyase-like n=1 Tax=Babylonia areolata TaxID=304850 RepID=UPI003FD206DE
MASTAWKCFPCSRRQLRLDVVLQCGQSFRWHENDRGEWLGVMSSRVWRLKQNDTHIYYQVYSRGTPHPQKDLETKCSPKAASKRHLSGAQASQAGQSKFQKRSHIQDHHTQVTDDALFQQHEAKKEIPDFSSNSQPTTFSKAVSEDTKEPCIKQEPQETDDTHLIAVLQDYFHLNVDIEELYQQWSFADQYFRKTASDFWGIRMLRQDPVENLFSFICSSNNNISRISSMVGKLCIQYGQPIAEVDGRWYHSFPAVAALAEVGVEEKLRELGFGYRAKFIAKSAKYIMDNHGEEWVGSLRHCSYEEAKAELMKLCGVGAKVADCVCLMSLDKAGAIPVDTHVWQFAARNYLPKLSSAKSVTDKLYQEIGDHFRSLWGPYAGWAHSVLFTAELRHMQSKKSSPEKAQKKEENPKKKRAGKSMTTAADVVEPLKRVRSSRRK